jgi:ATP-binding cassette subfamily C (CFTR/MRP) protein 4
LLQRPRVLVLDEATASCDVTTDQIIQHTLRTEFAATTVLTVAHRIHTIEDSDRVVVMDDGRIVECAAPATLLRDAQSLFSRLYAETRQQEVRGGGGGGGSGRKDD